jgi:hypothetical protein
MALQESEQKAEAGRIAAESGMKMSLLAIAAQKEQQAVADSTRRMTDQKRVAEETQQANALYAIQVGAFAQQIAALGKKRQGLRKQAAGASRQGKTVSSGIRERDYVHPG